MNPVRTSLAALAALAAAGPPRTALALPTLAELEAAARAHGLDNRVERAVAAQRALEARQAWHALLPSLSAQADYLHNQYATVVDIPAPPGGSPTVATITPRNQWDVTLSVTAPLIDVARWRAADAAERTRDAENAQLLATEADVARAVATTYYQLLAAEALVRAADRTRRAAEDNASFIAERRSAGFASELDALRARAEVERDGQAIADADYTRVTLARSLATLTGLAVTDAGDSAPPADDLHPEPPLETWIAGADATPAVAAALSSARAQSALAAQSRAALLPALSAQANERFTNAVGFGTSPYYSIGLVATWKLDFSSYTASTAADAATQAAEARADRSAASARDAIHDAWQNVRSKVVKCRAARAEREASARAAVVAAEKYAAGTASQLDLIQARRDDFTAEVTGLQADADLAAARASLRLIAGRPLFAAVTP